MTQPKIPLTPTLEKWIPIGIAVVITILLLYFKYNIIMSLIVGAIMWFVFMLQMKKLKGGEIKDVVKKETSNTATSPSSTGTSSTLTSSPSCPTCGRS